MRSSTYLDGRIKYSKHNLKILQIYYRALWKCLNFIARSVLRFLEICLCSCSHPNLISGVTGMQNLWLCSKTINIFHVILCGNTLHQFSSFTWEGLNYVMKKTIHMQSFLIKYGHIFWTFPTPLSKQKMMSENPNPYISLFLPLNTGKRQ